MEKDNLNLGCLRLISQEEVALMLQWRNAPEIRNNMYTTEIISMEEHLKWYEAVCQNPKMSYFMYENHLKEAQGIVAFTDIDMKNNHAFWAFYASPSAPKGTGSKMEFLALEWAFGYKELNKLNCEVLSHNNLVIKLHKKFGFVEEGCFKNHCYHNGTYRDVYRLALFKESWSIHRTRILNLLSKIYL